MKTQEFLKKHGLQEGDQVELNWEGGQEKGLVLPQKQEGILLLKLSSGYNAGFALGKIATVKKTGDGKRVGKGSVARLHGNPTLPSISILHTGGTVASRVDYRTGGVNPQFTDADMLTLYPELGSIANISSRLLSNMWSDDLRFTHFSIIAKAVGEEVKKGAQGIIIGMGTDNLAVAAAALSFALESLPVPVILVGSQRSSDRPSADAAENMVSAAQFITKTDFAGVAICMHHSTDDGTCAILPPTKTKKLHTSARPAFKAVNDSPIALVHPKTGKAEFLKQGYARKGGPLSVKPKFEERVALLKITIGMFPEQFSFYTEKKFKGLVIEGTALGHTPGHAPNKEAEIHRQIFPAIKEFIQSGGVCVMTTNCLWGRVNMNVYDKGRDLLALGVIPGEDMLPETAFVKIAWLLGNYPAEKAKELLAQNLRGEISERSLFFPEEEQHAKKHAESE